MAVLTVPVSGEFGVIVDQQPQEIPVNAWSLAKNMRFRDGCAERVEGDSQLFASTSVVPYYIAPFQNGNSRYFVHVGLANAYSDDGTTRTNITPATPFTGAIDDRFSGGTLGGVFVLNNNKEAPHFWGGTGVLAPLTGWPAATTAAFICPWKNILVAGDVTESGVRYPSTIRTSNEAAPGAVPTSWDYTDPTKTCIRRTLAEEASNLIDALPFGDALFIYKERAMYSMQIGGPLTYTTQRLPGNEGALGRGCIAAIPAGHVVLTAGDVILHSGHGPKSIINARLRRALFRDVDAQVYKRSFVAANPGRNEVWVCITSVNTVAPDKAYIWNYVDDTWTIRDLVGVTYAAVGQTSTTVADTWHNIGGTWGDQTLAWNASSYPPTAARLLTCATDSTIRLIDRTGMFNAVPYSSVLERVSMPIGEPSRVKTINAIEPRFDASTGTQIKIEIGASMDAEQLPVYSAPVTYTVGSSYRSYAFATGKWPAVRFTSLDNQPWRLKSYDIHYTEGGQW